MGSVTGFTAERSQEIEDQAIIGGSIVGDDLILTRNNEDTINAGNVRGSPGVPGPPGGLGEAPVDGTTYGRKDAAWVAVPASAVAEAPTDGKVYARKDGAWIIAPGTLLGEEFNPTDSNTSLASAVAFAGDGTKVTVAVPARGVTVEFGAVFSHSDGGNSVGVQLYIDGTLQARGETHDFIPASLAKITSGKTATFPAGEISVGNRLFEIKAKQESADAQLFIYESWISVKAN